MTQATNTLGRSCLALRLSAHAAVWAALALAGTVARAAPEKEAAQEVVRARRFELVDEAGRVRVSLRVEAGPRLMFYDTEGRHRLALALQGEGAPGLEIFTPDGGHALQVRAMNDETLVKLHDLAGRERLRLAVPPGPEARPTLVASGADGKVESTWPPTSTPPPK